MYPAIVRLYNYCDARGRSFELLTALFLAGVIYTYSSIPDVVPIQGVVTQILGVASNSSDIFYFVLGMVVRRRYDELLLESVPKTLLYLMSIPLLCTIIGIFNYAYEYFNLDVTQILTMVGDYWYLLTATVTPLYYVAIFALCLYISRNMVSSRAVELKLLEKIGTYSFGIYLIHAFVLYVIVLIFSRFGFDWNKWLFYPLNCVMTLIFSYFSVEVLQKLPYSECLIGNTR